MNILIYDDVEIKISLVQVEDLEKKVANVIETDKQMSEVSSLTLYHFIFRSLYILIPQKLRSFETSKFYL